MHVSITISDIEAGSALVESFRDEWVQGKKAQRWENKIFASNKRAKLYQTIQTAYGIAAELMKPENEAVLLALLAKHGLKRDERKGSNPWVAPVNLLFGTWVEAKGVKSRAFKADRSAWKYAASFRFFHEHRWPHNEIAERLANHTSNFLGKSQFGKGLIATQKEDAYRHSRDDADVQDDNNQLKRFIARALPIAELPKHDALINDGGERRFVALWGIVVDQTVLVYGELPKRSGAVLAQALKAARELEQYMDAMQINAEKSPAKRKDPRTPKLIPRYLPPNVVNDKGHLVRKDGMSIVDIEAMSAQDVANAETDQNPKLNDTSPRATVEVPLPIKCDGHLQNVTGGD